MGIKTESFRLLGTKDALRNSQDGIDDGGYRSPRPSRKARKTPVETRTLAPEYLSIYIEPMNFVIACE